MQESGEMYLETIRILSENNSHVRAVDVCTHMGFSKPSVSRGLSLLKKDGLIEINNDGYITLTDDGRLLADKIYSKHNTLYSLLCFLGVNEATADNDACRMEHVISEETFIAIKEFLDNQLSD